MEEALQSGKPCTSREETISALKSLCTGSRAPLLVSDVPLGIKKTSKVVMGIDEAGRGPLLGPMVYAAAYWDKNDSELIPKGLADSKVLSSATRTALLEDIQSTDKIGFVVRVLHAYEISSNMLRKEPYNLNAMSHDAAMQMIRSVLEAGVNINTCYIDTVGPPESYKAKLEREFEGHNISFIVEKKADAKYTCCSAASVGKSSSRLITKSFEFCKTIVD
jgi:ribonuclease H2 subunit A